LKRVLVIQSKHLLAAGILSLLNREMDLSVFDAICNDEIALLEHIKDIKPAVLVMDESSQLTDNFSFISLLNDSPDLRVIVIDERKNRMHIYEMQELEVGRAADLVTAIRREEQAPC
jgi:chemotaxis response regulator CheB